MRNSKTINSITHSILLMGVVISSTVVSVCSVYAQDPVIYAELSGDFPLGDSRQPTYKSLRPFDLVS